MPFILLYIFACWQIKKHGYSNELPLQNRYLTRLSKSKESAVKVSVTHSRSTNILPLSQSTALKLLLLTAASLILTGLFGNYQAVNKEICLNMERQEAIALAKQELIAHAIDPHTYKIVASLSDESSVLEMQYVFEQVKLQQALELAKATGQGIYWKVRFFKPLDAKEYEVWLNQKGAVEAFVLIEPEDAPGQKLPAETARNKVESYLKTKHSQWQPYKFESLQENTRKERIDYTFTYTVPHLKVGEADFKVSVSVLGDIISGLDADYDLPDQWLNEHNKKTIRDEIFLQMRNAFNVLLFLVGIVWVFGLLKHGQIKWKTAYLISLPLIAISFIQYLNNFPQLYHSYLTTLPLYSYILNQATSYLELMPWNFLYYFCSFAIALTALYTVIDKSKLMPVILLAFAKSGQKRSAGQRTLWLNSWLITLSAISLHAAINGLSDTLHACFSPACPFESLSTVCTLANVGIPWLALLAEAISTAMNQLILLSICAGLYKRFCSGFAMYALFVIVFNLITYSSARYWQDFTIDVLSSSLWELAIWFFIVKIIRFNPLAYFLIGFMDSLLSNLIDILAHAFPIYLTAISTTCLLILPQDYMFFIYD